MFIGILIIGESHAFYLDNFYTQYSNTTLYLQLNTTSKEMITDISNSSTRNKVEVFTFIRTQPNISLTEYNIYGTQGVENLVNQNSNIFKRNYKSLFLGSINFKFNNIDDVPNIKNQTEYYVIGSKDNIKQFKMDLIDKYAGNHPKEGISNKESVKNIIAIWILIISIILLFSFYDVISQKKENLIRMTMGEKIGNIIWKNILLDTFVFMLSFILILFILFKYTFVFFDFKISLMLFIISLILNGLLYLSLYFLNVKEVFSNSKNSKNLLSINYGIKLITTIITIFIISSNIGFIYQSYTFYKQQTFFEDHSDYFHIKFMYYPINYSDGTSNDRIVESMTVQETFYKEFFKEFNTMAVKDISGIVNKGAISANKNSFNYLSTKIIKLNNFKLNKDFYFILPDKMKNDSKIVDVLKKSIPFNDDVNLSYNYDLIYYHENIDVVGMDEDEIYGSTLIKNPIIIYNNMSEALIKNQSIRRSIGSSDELYDVMYEISSATQLDKLNKFIKTHKLEGQFIQKINVLEKYENMWIIAKRILYINLIFSFLVLLLEIIIINSIITLEYKVNAIELSIKKVLGYNILQKNSKIVMMTVVTTILSIVIAVIVNIMMETKKGYYLVFGGISILILELSVILFYIRKIENSQVQKILKGRNL